MLNFSISELIYSDIAKKFNINNFPSEKELNNILELIFYCLQPIRNLIQKPMIITSGYRCKKLNELVNGVKNSSHLRGCAADFIVKEIPIKDVVEMISNSNIPFDELINEYDKWVHISFVKGKNRRKILKIS
ncbi:MAG: hypothetical protein IKL52_02205 [Candidatus Gastranaerophilales bacterium]|nr:hypothetical protein [Candidatus Gastranaerophilales bacterium]